MDLLPLVTFFVAFISSIVSGLAGGGGGFIMAPYWLLIGLTPAQGATTGAFMAIGMGGGSLSAFRKQGYFKKKRLLIMLLLALTFATSWVGPLFLNSISVALFRPLLAILTLASLPFLFIKPRPNAQRGHTKFGFVLLGIILLASSFITSSAFSILMTAILLQFFNVDVLESTALRRAIGIVQSAVIFIVLFCLGHFVWQHATMGLLGGTLGSYLGTRFAIRRGEVFAKYALVAGALISVILLVI